MVGSAPSSVIRWRDAVHSGGEEALKVRFSPGRPPTLTSGQRKQLVKLLLKGAMANGFSTELWTTARVAIAILIRQHCRVQFHRSHVARLLHDLGFSCQKPERRALERDEEKIEQWKRSQWPRIKIRYAVGCPHRLLRRIQVHDDPAGAPYVGAGRRNTDSTPLLPS